jgi:hypothetical protein
MITRMLELNERSERQLQLTTAAYGLTCDEFIKSAILAAIETCRENNPRLALVLDYADERQTVKVNA